MNGEKKNARFKEIKIISNLDGTLINVSKRLIFDCIHLILS